MVKGSHSIFCFGIQFILLRMKKTISFLMPWNLQRIVETIGFGSSIVLVSGFLGPKVNNYLMQPMDWQKLNKLIYAIYFWDGGSYSVSPWTWICGVTNNCSGRLPSLSETMCYAEPPPLPGETQTPYAWPRVETGIQYIPILRFYPHKYAIDILMFLNFVPTAA